MPNIFFELFDALRSAGMTEGKARAAAETLTKAQCDLSDIKANVRLLTCRVNLLTGALLLIGLPSLALLYRIVSKVGGLG